MDKKKLRECLYKKYITPTERTGEDYIGIEIEMPVVNLSGEATDFSVTQVQQGSLSSIINLSLSDTMRTVRYTRRLIR